VILSDGTVRTAEADRRDRQVPAMKKMADKLKTLTAKAWPQPRRRLSCGS
jgi:hypothetical protein